MACVPFTAPPVGLFDNATQGVWNNVNESKGGRSCTYSAGSLTVSGPNGTLPTFVGGGGGRIVKHKFFGTGNYLAVFMTDPGPGPVQRFLEIIDFTAPTITSKQALFYSADPSNAVPWVQNSLGNGSCCMVGGPTNFGVVGLSILRSDTGDVICAGPSPATPSIQFIGDATTTTVRIKDGGNVVPGATCNLPAGQLSVTPPSQTFTAVKVGGCPQPPSTKVFNLKNIGNDCLTVNGVTASGPFSATSATPAFPVPLNPNQTMTVTVTFAPAAQGTFTNVNVAVGRTPAGTEKLVCSGQAVLAQPGFSVSGPTPPFGSVPVGSSKPATVVVTNTGDVPISVSVPTGLGPPFTWTGVTTTLGCAASLSIPVTFAPIAEGPASDALQVTATPGGSKTVTLSGAGCIPNATIVVPPAPFPAFGDVRQGYRMPRFITVANTGDGTLTFTASISGPDAALFGLMDASQSIISVLPSRAFSVDPASRCGAGPTGDGKEEVVVVFFANGAPPKTANATLTIDNHNDPAAPVSITRPLVANIIAGNVVDAVAVFDTSGSMAQAVPGGGDKMAAAIQGGRLFLSLIPPDLGNRVAATRFSTDATTFLGMGEVTAANQAAKVAAIQNPPLAPNGSTAIAAGIMTGLPEFAVARTAPAPAKLTKAVVVLTDGMDNTAFKNPADNQYYSILGQPAYDPANLGNLIPTKAFVPPSDVGVYAVALGTGADIDTAQLAALSSGAGGYYGAVDPTQPAVVYRLMKFYTQIYMDLVDTSTIADPRDTILPGQKHIIEFDVLAGDVSAIVVMYDFNGLRLPFWLETPRGEIIDAGFVPPGFQLRAGYTEATRFLDFVLPWADPLRYAGRWKLIVVHDGRACRGQPSKEQKELGFLPNDCSRTKSPVDYGYAIGVGSNFRLQAYVTPGAVRVGEPIRLTGVPSEAGLAITGCTVTVDATGPNGQTWPTIVLADDGAHDDGDADDGEYARRFTQTAVPGSYTFRFRATGFNRDGKPVTREAVRSKYVVGWIEDPHTHDGQGGQVGDDCCEKLVSLLERETALLTRFLEVERREQN